MENGTVFQSLGSIYVINLDRFGGGMPGGASAPGYGCPGADYGPLENPFGDEYWHFGWVPDTGADIAAGDGMGAAFLMPDLRSGPCADQPTRRVFLIPKQELPGLSRVAGQLVVTPLADIHLAWGRLATGLMGSLTPAVLADICRRPWGRHVMERQILTLLRLLVDVAHSREPGGDASGQGRRERLWRRLVLWMHEHYCDPRMSASMAAEQFNVSVRYVFQLFSDFSCRQYQQKETFHSVLNRLRLEHAAAMLKDPQMGEASLAEIAALCGYTDPVYFGKAFKQRFGQSPGKLRASWAREWEKEDGREKQSGLAVAGHK